MKTLVSIVFLGLLTACGPAPADRPQTVNESPAVEPDEGAAILVLQDINDAQENFLRRNRRYALTYEELVDSFFLNQAPAEQEIGYRIRMRPSADAIRYSVSAAPANASSTARYLFTDQTRALRAEQGHDATAESPTIEH